MDKQRKVVTVVEKLDLRDSNLNYPGCYTLADPVSGVFVLGTSFNLQMARNRHDVHIWKYGLLFSILVICDNDVRESYYNQFIQVLKSNPLYAEMVNESFPIRMFDKMKKKGVKTKRRTRMSRMVMEKYNKKHDMQMPLLIIDESLNINYPND